MRQRLSSRDVSIEDLLSGEFAFSIPAYQRDFSWTRDEAVQLLDDVAAVLDDVERDGADTPYFLGTMLFVEQKTRKTAKAPSRQVEVVDGQQRLITLTILFAVLRDLVDDGSAPELSALVARQNADGEPVYHLKLRAADESFMQSAIQQQGATRRSQPAAAIGDNSARRNIEDVRRALRSKLQRELSVPARNRLVEFMRQNVRLLVVSSDDFDYAYQIFLTINDRGKRLTVEDIFRGEILGPLDREQRRRSEAIIDEIEKYREAAEPNRTKGKTFFSHLATIDGWPRRGIIEGLKKAVEKRGGPRRFVTDVFAPMAESYLVIKGAPGGARLPAEIEHWLLALRWLELHGDDDWVPVAMVGISRLSAEPASLNAFLRSLDRFAHGLMALGCGREARRRHYAPILKEILEARTFPDPEQLFVLTPGNQKTILRNIATRMHLVDRPTAKLILVRADQALSERPLTAYREALERDRHDPRRLTVEHVCPRGRIETGEWPVIYPRKNVRERTAECIGNLLLVTDDQNRLCSQKDFADKKEIFFGGEPSAFILTEMLREEPAWDSTAVTRRYNLIMGALKQLWQLQGAVPPCPALGNVPAVPREPEQPIK